MFVEVTWYPYWFTALGLENEREQDVFLRLYKTKQDIELYNDFFSLQICLPTYKHEFYKEHYYDDIQKIKFEKYYTKLMSGDINFFVSKIKYPDKPWHFTEIIQPLTGEKYPLMSKISPMFLPNFACVFVKDFNIYKPSKLLKSVNYIYKQLFKHDVKLEFANYPSNEEVKSKYEIAVKNGHNNNYVTLEYLKQMLD